MNICVFCSSSSNLAECYVHAAQKLGETLAKRGHTLVFGGYDMGLMGDVAKAVLVNGGKVVWHHHTGPFRKGPHNSARHRRAPNRKPFQAQGSHGCAFGRFRHLARRNRHA